MGRRSLKRRTATWMAVFAGAYLGIAYLAAPELWTLHSFLRGPLPSGMVTRTPQGIAGDPVNIGLVGNKAEVIHAFGLARWDTADAVTLKSAVEIGASVLFDHPYPDAPVSRPLFEGRPQDLSFEKPVGESADQRHHVRLWQTAETGEDGRPLWLGSASFDRGVGLSHDTGAITHHIGPDLDAERDLLIADLSDAGTLVSTSEMTGIGKTDSGRNGGGDLYFTDGKILLGLLRSLP